MAASQSLTQTRKSAFCSDSRLSEIDILKEEKGSRGQAGCVYIDEWPISSSKRDNLSYAQEDARNLSLLEIVVSVSSFPECPGGHFSEIDEAWHASEIFVMSSDNLCTAAGQGVVVMVDESSQSVALRLSPLSLIGTSRRWALLSPLTCALMAFYGYG